MRCEICNRSMTELMYDGEGSEHWYCAHCEEEILDTLGGYDQDEEDTFWDVFDTFEPLPDDSYGDEDEEISEDNQGVNEEEEGDH